MTYMTPTEQKIHAHCLNGKAYNGDPYHASYWTERNESGFLYWSNSSKEHGSGEQLQWIPNMANAIQQEANEYNDLYDKGLWKPSQPMTEIETADEYSKVLREHQELATLRDTLKKLDWDAANRQRELSNMLIGLDSPRYFADNIDKNLMKIHNYNLGD